MAILNEIQKSVELQGPEKTSEWLVKGLKEKTIKAENLSVRTIFEEILTDEQGRVCGHDILRRMGGQQKISEGAASAVSTQSFIDIMGQIAYNAMLEGAQLAQFTLAPEFGVVASQLLNVEEKFPRIANLGDAAKPIPEGESYPVANLNSSFVNSPMQVKKGMICPVTRETIINDRIGMVMERAREVGEALGVAREIEACDALIANGGSSDAYAYRYKGTSYAPWQTSATALPYYDNVTSSNVLQDYGSIKNAEITLATILDDLTGLPTLSGGEMVLVCGPELRYDAERVLHTLQYRTAASGVTGYASQITDGGLSPAPFRIVVNKFLSARLTYVSQATSNYYFGDVKKALKFVRSLDITAAQADERSGLAFSNDILYQFKGTKLETAAWYNPRFITKCTVS